ncbi:hypothetical protein DFR70_112154 [Nocardia tenerifensis]|uniref:Uncharacterized protein n=1 Tax=Nocardia tenerifensis TaxID=228006 RepID=A0A318JSP2_9NOCA|nr:hypothetical protein [Nocardia tenerifensis]PXX59237.1 hypothetical protein DFR70_112154 [Nocardia tenerifensis]
MQRGEPTAIPICASEAADLIDRMDHAADIAARIAEKADAAIGRTARRRIGTPEHQREMIRPNRGSAIR